MNLQRPMVEIYKQAQSIAEDLQHRAELAADQSKDLLDKLKATDIVFSCKRFALQARKAVDTIPTMRNDGTLRAYCEQFDKTFNNFVVYAGEFEQDLIRIESTFKKSTSL